MLTCRKIRCFKNSLNKVNPILFIILTGLCLKTYGQVNESPKTGVYEYLYRMAQKGMIDWNDYRLPLDRKEIAAALDQLAASNQQLSKTEASELRFYEQEYAFDAADSSTHDTKILFRKDAANRLRAGLFEKGQARLFVDPVFGLQYLKTSNSSGRQYFTGIRLGGYFGKRWGFNFSFRDNTEKGDTLSHNRSFTPAQGIIPTMETNRYLNYSSLNFNIGYKWSNGAISAGQENLTWGYGIGGNTVLSDKVPSFPFIKFDFSPWSWLHFNYFHGWLHSNIIDSAASYNTGTGLYNSDREVYRSKFIAHHSIKVTPVKGLDLAVGESIVYSDKLNFAYLIPINFFKIYDHYNSRYNIRAGDNSQFFGLISSRNHLKNTHAYAQLFIDEIRPAKIFNNNEKRNQLGYTLGINRTDLFIPYLTAGIEYSRINPFVYNNLIPAQTYESHSYPLGDWMGNNADRLYLFLHYVPLPKMKIKAWHQQIRKGPGGSLEQQYYIMPQPKFLFEKLFNYKEAGISVRYEWLNKLVFYGELNKVTTTYVNGNTTKNNGIKIGFSYGL